MKKLLVLLSFLSLSATAQVADPVVMTVNGEKITRSAFEYAYNKNLTNEDDRHTMHAIEEYAEMFLNYKLKLAAGRAAKLDTLSSLRQQFQQHRNQYLATHLIDQHFIDSVATSIYQRMAKRVGDKGLFRAAHILITLPQQTSEEVIKKGFLKADSLYQLLKNGADFSTLAQQHSQDKGSTRKGGELPWLGPGETIEEFEHQIDKMQVGETAAPFLTPVGYHIVRLLERKPLESYDSLRPKIIASLRQQGIEEASAEQRIQRLIAQSGNTRTREAILDSVYHSLASDPEVKYLIQEYEEGLLFFETCQRFLWDKSAKDTKGLEDFFKKNRSKYNWTAPRFKGFVYLAKDKKTAKAGKAFIKTETSTDNWRQKLKAQFNPKETTLAIMGPLLSEAGENSYVDEHVFGGAATTPPQGLPVVGVVGKKLSQPASYEDVYDKVLADYREVVEKEWIAELRKQFPYHIDKAVLQTVNQH